MDDNVEILGKMINQLVAMRQLDGDDVMYESHTGWAIEHLRSLQRYIQEKRTLGYSNIF